MGFKTWTAVVLLAVAAPAFAQAPPAACPPYADSSPPLPLDLPTALRLANANSPTIAVAQARVRQALARLDQASVLWLPNLTLGTTYLRHDGQIQNSRGMVFTISRSSLFAGGGPQLRVDSSEAYFLPLVARRLAQAETARAQEVTNRVQLDVALAYLDLVEVYGRLAVNADTLARAEQMERAAESGDKAGLNRTTADINRAATEVQLRRQERIDLRGRAAAVSARLAGLLLLQPTVELEPAEPAIVPVVLVPFHNTLEQLVQIGLQNRPELASYQATLAAANVRVRQAQVGPFLPRLQLDYLGGVFGGGVNNDMSNFDGRGDLTAQAYWELRNLGLGNRAEVRERRAAADEANFRLIETQAQVAAEVTEAAKLAAARIATLESAQEAVRQALEMYRKLLESSFGMAGPRPLFDALQPLLAIQALNQARVQYLLEVIEFNRAQFRLYTALGQPALCALPDAAPQAVDVPVEPPPPAATLPAPTPLTPGRARVP
jgi:outer membrane protein TolC